MPVFALSDHLLLTAPVAVLAELVVRESDGGITCTCNLLILIEHYFLDGLGVPHYATPGHHGIVVHHPCEQCFVV